MNNRELIFFEPNRVWRCYLGGALLEKLRTGEMGMDGYFPEDWLGSVTRADNGAHSTGADEGLAKIRGTGETFAARLARDGAALTGGEGNDPGVLCKFLDSAIRLPVQCHPDRAFAREFCRSEYGKTESWFILDTRTIDGEAPYILFGFRPGISAAAWERAVEAQDIPALTGMMHKIPVQPGEAYLVPGRLPHAIGAGVLMLEVQEPTDLVVQPEKRIGAITLTDRDMWGKLTPEQGLACFDYTGIERGELLKKWRIVPEIEQQGGGVLSESLIDARYTDCFRVRRLTLGKNATHIHRVPGPWQLGIVTAGDGTAAGGGFRRGDTFFVPHQLREFEIVAGETGATIHWVG